MGADARSYSGWFTLTVPVSVEGKSWRTGLEFSTRKGGFVNVLEREHVGKAAFPGSSQVFIRPRGEGKSQKRA